MTPGESHNEWYQYYCSNICPFNVRQKYVFDPIVHLIKYKLEPIYVFLSGNAGGVGKSVVLRALYLY